MRYGDLRELGKMANAIKQQLHPENITTFIIDRNINYTNICWVDCKFCAFKRRIGEEGVYILSFEEIDKKIDELLAIGGTQILFQGGVHPKLKIKICAYQKNAPDNLSAILVHVNDIKK